MTHANGRLAAEDLSEEDQQLKSELDMLVERLTVRSRRFSSFFSITREVLT